MIQNNVIWHKFLYLICNISCNFHIMNTACSIPASTTLTCYNYLITGHYNYWKDFKEANYDVWCTTVCKSSSILQIGFYLYLRVVVFFMVWMLLIPPDSVTVFGNVWRILPYIPAPSVTINLFIVTNGSIKSFSLPMHLPSTLLYLAWICFYYL